MDSPRSLVPHVPRIPSVLLAALAVAAVPSASTAQPRPVGEPLHPAIRRPLIGPLVRPPPPSLPPPATDPTPAEPASPSQVPDVEDPAPRPPAAPLPAAQAPAPPPPAPPPAPSPATPPPAEGDRDRATITLSGWSDVYYAYNLNEPSNDVNSLRLYDARHNHIGFNSLALDLNWRVETVSGHAIFQFGTLASEFFYPAADLARAQQELPWRILQEVTFAWAPRIGGRQPLTFEGGIFVAPFGPEYIQIYKNWCWSASNLFYIAPFQLSGVRASWAVNDRWTVRAGVYSGWDQVLDDNNPGKSVLLQAEYAAGDDVFVSVQYMVGAEHDRAAREGPWARHTLDAYGEFRVHERVQLRAHVFAGVEPNRLGVNAWAAGALHARVKLFDWLYVAGRGDFVVEWIPTYVERPATATRPAVTGVGESLFGLPDASPYGSGTGTIEFLPHRHLSLRLEFRHDGALGGLFYRGNVPVDAATRAPIFNAASQDTIAAGATAWF